MNKKLLSLLFLATPFLTFSQEKGLDQKIDEAFGNATGWFVDIIFYQIPFTDTVTELISGSSLIVLGRPEQIIKLREFF